jgi:hypothetical protein
VDDRVSSVVWKYPFPEGADRLDIELPYGARVLSFGFQGTVACFWALVEPGGHRVARKFRIFGTGHPLPDDGRFEYLATAFPGAFVFHLFEEVT